MPQSFSEIIHQRIQQEFGREIDINKYVVIRCTKASWEYDMNAYMLGQSYPMLEDATLQAISSIFSDQKENVKLLLVCECDLVEKSVNRVMGPWKNCRQTAILHGMKCFLMMLRDKVILNRIMNDQDFFYLVTNNKEGVEFHTREKQLMIDFVRNLLN